jgi:hypothetical protein
VTIPLTAPLTAHRKSACWALRRLDGPTTNLRTQSRDLRSKSTDTADDQSRQCQLPQRLHTPTPDVSAGQRSAESGEHGGVDPNFRAYSGRTQRHPIRFTRLRRSQACDPELSGPPKRRRFDTPIGYTKRASKPRFSRSEALSGTWWQVKDSNLRSFRDGFADHRLQARDQRQCSSPNRLPGVFPADSRRQPTPAVANRTPPRPPGAPLPLAGALRLSDRRNTG